MKQFEKILKALANKRRLAIVQFLKSNPSRSVGEIAQKIKLSFKATSKHLHILSAADILDPEKRSLQIYYSLSAQCPALAKQIISKLKTLQGTISANNSLKSLR